MSATALATIPASEPTKLAKPRRISKRMQQVLNLLATKGMTQRDAAAKVGMSEFHISRELKKPQIQAFIATKVRQSIALGSLRAGARLIEMVDASSEHVSLDASKHVLAIEGIKPPEDGRHVSVNVGVSVGWVLDLRDEGNGSEARVIDHASALKHD